MDIPIGRTQVAAVFRFFIASRGLPTRASPLLTLVKIYLWILGERRGRERTYIQGQMHKYESCIQDVVL